MDMGIIGGANGPTVIFVFSQIHWFEIISIAVAAIICVIVFYIFKSKKK